MAKSYYAILEISANASEADIRSAFRRLAKEYHPDRYAGTAKHSGKFKRPIPYWGTVGDDENMSREFSKCLQKLL